MIPFHLIYTWLFRSFRIDSETTMVKNLAEEGVQSIIIIKRSWIYALFLSWIPLAIFFMTILNIYILFTSYQEETVLRMVMIIIMVVNTGFYFVAGLIFIIHFRNMHMSSTVWTNIDELIDKLKQSDRYFINFFNQSIFVQLVVIGIIIFDVFRIIAFRDRDIIFATIDIINLVCIWLLLRHHRMKLVDMEMDFNVAVPGKIYFANQTGVLSSMYSIEANKIKSIRATYPNGIASFFHYGNIDILTEGDTQMMMGQMSMYYVTTPDVVVGEIQKMLVPVQLDLQRQELLPKDKGNILASSDEKRGRDNKKEEGSSDSKKETIIVNVGTNVSQPTPQSPSIRIGIKEKVAKVTGE